MNYALHVCRTLHRAVRAFLAEWLADLGVYWMEEPLHRGDYDGMAELRRSKIRRRGNAERPTCYRNET